MKSHGSSNLVRLPLGGYLCVSTTVISICNSAFVRCREVVRFSEGPLWEVRLYTCVGYLNSNLHTVQEQTSVVLTISRSLVQSSCSMVMRLLIFSLTRLASLAGSTSFRRICARSISIVGFNNRITSSACEPEFLQSIQMGITHMHTHTCCLALLCGFTA